MIVFNYLLSVMDILGELVDDWAKKELVSFFLELTVAVPCVHFSYFT